jgi:hypothetical protein
MRPKKRDMAFMVVREKTRDNIRKLRGDNRK